MSACNRCQGAGYVTYSSNPDVQHRCHVCDATGEFPELGEQMAGIVALLRGHTGFRKSRPRFWPDGSDRATKIMHQRAYYLWRMARFHGGVDMRMPVSADMDALGDPDRPTLDALADQLAQDHFGSSQVAARRWGQTLGVAK